MKAVCEILLRSGANINAVNCEEETPIASFIKGLATRRVYIEDDGIQIQEEVGEHDVAAQSADEHQNKQRGAAPCSALEA